MPLTAVPGLMYLRSSLSGASVAKTRGRHQGGINNRTLLGGHAPIPEVVFCRLKNLFTQAMVLQQVPGCQLCGLRRDSVANQLAPGIVAHPPRLNQGLFHCRITQAVPVLQSLDGQHCRQRVRQPTAVSAGAGMIRLDPMNQGLLKQHNIYLSQLLFVPGSILGNGLHVINEPEPLALY